MSFSGQSNQWQRGTVSSYQPQPMPVFMQQTPPQQTNMAYGSWPASGGLVSYPQSRSTGLNPAAFPQTQGTGASNAGGSNSQHYNSIGTVTKINSDCGLVNDEVYFYRNVCKGHAPKLGDRVLFEATYTSSGQFKWNATRIQLMPQHPQALMGSSGNGGGKSSVYNAVPPPNEYQRAQLQRHNSPRRFSPTREGRRSRSERDRRDRDRIHRSRDRDDDEHGRKRRREDHARSRERIASTSRGSNAVRHDRERDRERDRGDRDDAKQSEHSVDRKDRERERERDRDMDRVERVDRSPYRLVAKGRRARTIRRYMVQIPKSLLSYKNAGVQELRQRYTTLYVPSDFFHANIKWSETFTPENAFSLRRPCQFHIMHKIVDPPTLEQEAENLEPADADYIYSAKVMLLACPPIAELYQKCFEDDDSDNEQNTVHPSRLISFLVGTRGRNEPMAVGGPWSASLDGENPDKDPAVLIRTAIRTCKALTGIDLSNCTQWYRFMELYYYRTDYKHKEKDGPPRVETVVIYLPDIHSCMPSICEWQTLTQIYKAAVDEVITRKTVASKAVAVAVNATATTGIEAGSGSSTVDQNYSNLEQTVADNKAAAIIKVADCDAAMKAVAPAVELQMNNAETDVDANADAVADANADADDPVAVVAESDDTKKQTTQEVIADGDENELNEKGTSQQQKPTHNSKLDLKAMKVQEIRDELMSRNLPAKGARHLVAARLAKALNAEKANEMESNKTMGSNNAEKEDEVNKMVADTEPSKTQTSADEMMTKDEHEIGGNNHNKADNVKTNDGNRIASKAEDSEELEEWADIIDVDMSDIVILDEYDSSKYPEESIKEMDEKEQNQLIRRYTLPATPHIVVHPHKTAKGGKFDCSVMSLSVLLDYRPDDTKERFFEVSLFAELFNEMLMRDFGFNIYKELFLYQEAHGNENAESNNEEVNSKKTELAANDNDVKKKENADSKLIQDGTGDKPARKYRTSKRSLDEEPEEDNQSAKSSDRKRKSSIAVSASGSIKDKENVSDKKIVVHKPELLLSFVYFDTSHCGYIFEKDLEDLFSILGLNLSRGQIRKVLGKLATRQAFYYRKLTDKEESAESMPTIEDADDLPAEELKKIAIGNWQYADIFQNPIEGTAAATGNSVPQSTENEGLINYNGAVVHVGKLVNQIKRSEKNYSDLEKLHNDLRKQHTELQKDYNKSSGKIKDLQSDVKSLSRKLTDADQELIQINRKYSQQLVILSSIYNRVAPYFVREKDKEHKSDSTRDKDADKDKEKHKDKEGKEGKEKEKYKGEGKHEMKHKKNGEDFKKEEHVKSGIGTESKEPEEE